MSSESIATLLFNFWALPVFNYIQDMRLVLLRRLQVVRVYLGYGAPALSQAIPAYITQAQPN